MLQIPLSPRLLVAATMLPIACGLTACGGDDSPAAVVADTPKTITVENCGTPVEFRLPIDRMVVTSNSTNYTTLLKIGAADRIAAAQINPGTAKVLAGMYGPEIEQVERLTAPISLEAVVAKRPDVLVGSYSGLFAGSSGVTEAKARSKGIQPYVISDSCRQDPTRKGSKLGVMGPWDAVRTDLENYGRLTEREREAAAARKELDERLARLEQAPSPARKPKVLLFDSGTKALYTSGRKGSPQGIIEAAGGENVFASEDTTWFEASWERVAAAKPDVVVILDYRSDDPKEIEQKRATLVRRAGLKDLPVIREERIVVLPLTLFMSGYANIDAAERLRDELERLELVPRRDDA